MDSFRDIAVTIPIANKQALQLSHRPRSRTIRSLLIPSFAEKEKARH